MSDNTANWHTCPDCGVLIDGRYAHACPGTPWQPVTLSPGMVFDAEIKDYLRRIAETLEDLAVIGYALMTPDVRAIVLDELNKAREAQP